MFKRHDTWVGLGVLRINFDELSSLLVSPATKKDKRTSASIVNARFFWDGCREQLCVFMEGVE